jgi:hypothetical protein
MQNPVSFDLTGNHVKQGYHGTSMRQIAQKADITLGSLYYHFRYLFACYSGKNRGLMYWSRHGQFQADFSDP